MSIDSTLSPAAVDEVSRFVGRLGGALGEQWAPAGRKCVTRAPGRLDVLGGFAEYTGSLTLSYPLARGVLAAVAPRDDQMILVCSLAHEGNGSPEHERWPLATFYDESGSLARGSAVAAALSNCSCGVARHVFAALYALLEQKAVPHLGGGLTIGIRSELTGVVGAGAPAATTAATMLALDRVLDLQLDPVVCAELACRGQNLLWGRAQGGADAASVVFGRPGEILQFNCQTGQVAGTMPLPEGITLTGIDCGARASEADRKYTDARVAAFMGRALISRILNARPARVPNWSGHLSQLTVSDYVERVRDRLPTKIKGAAFIERFGGEVDSWTTIEPDKVYKLRSRTEHHLYENARARQFATRISRALRTNDRQAVTEAGELMYASHWSYGQRCGLGCIETDRLVSALRVAGVDRGIYGAKISGRGAGGTVVVLHADTDGTREAIKTVLEQYTRQTGLEPDVLTGTSPGASFWGVHDLS